MLWIIKATGEIKFHVALSNGVLPVGDKYKAVSVRTSSTESSTWLTAKRERQQEILDGQRILNDINNEVHNAFGSFNFVFLYFL